MIEMRETLYHGDVEILVGDQYDAVICYENEADRVLVVRVVLDPGLTWSSVGVTVGGVPYTPYFMTPETTDGTAKTTSYSVQELSDIGAPRVGCLYVAIHGDQVLAAGATITVSGSHSCAVARYNDPPNLSPSSSHALYVLDRACLRLSASETVVGNPGLLEVMETDLDDDRTRPWERLFVGQTKLLGVSCFVHNLGTRPTTIDGVTYASGSAFPFGLPAMTAAGNLPIPTRVSKTVDFGGAPPVVQWTVSITAGRPVVVYATDSSASMGTLAAKVKAQTEYLNLWAEHSFGGTPDPVIQQAMLGLVALHDSGVSVLSAPALKTISASGSALAGALALMGDWADNSAGWSPIGELVWQSKLLADTSGGTSLRPTDRCLIVVLTDGKENQLSGGLRIEAGPTGVDSFRDGAFYEWMVTKDVTVRFMCVDPAHLPDFWDAWKTVSATDPTPPMEFVDLDAVCPLLDIYYP